MSKIITSGLLLTPRRCGSSRDDHIVGLPSLISGKLVSMAACIWKCSSLCPFLRSFTHQKSHVNSPLSPIIRIIAAHFFKSKSIGRLDGRDSSADKMAAYITGKKASVSISMFVYNLKSIDTNGTNHDDARGQQEASCMEHHYARVGRGCA